MHKKLSAAIDARLSSLDDNFPSVYLEDMLSCYIAENDGDLLDLHTKEKESSITEKWVVLNKKHLCVYEGKSKRQSILSMNSTKAPLLYKYPVSDVNGYEDVPDDKTLFFRGDDGRTCVLSFKSDTTSKRYKEWSAKLKELVKEEIASSTATTNSSSTNSSISSNSKESGGSVSSEVSSSINKPTEASASRDRLSVSADTPIKKVASSPNLGDTPAITLTPLSSSTSFRNPVTPTHHNNNSSSQQQQSTTLNVEDGIRPRAASFASFSTVEDETTTQTLDTNSDPKLLIEEIARLRKKLQNKDVEYLHLKEIMALEKQQLQDLARKLDSWEHFLRYTLFKAVINEKKSGKLQKILNTILEENTVKTKSYEITRMEVTTVLLPAKFEDSPSIRMTAYNDASNEAKFLFEWYPNNCTCELQIEGKKFIAGGPISIKFKVTMDLLSELRVRGEILVRKGEENQFYVALPKLPDLKFANPSKLQIGDIFDLSSWTVVQKSIQNSVTTFLSKFLIPNWKEFTF